MIQKTGWRLPAFAKPTSAGEGWWEKIMLEEATPGTQHATAA